MKGRHEVVSAVISDIKNGKYRLAETLTQRRIVANYDVGRWVAMRALEDLEASSWLERGERGRYSVAEITDETFKQALEMRTLLEIYAANKLIEIVTEPLIRRLWKINNDMWDAGNAGKFKLAVQHNRDFHETIVGSVDHGPLLRQLNQLYQIQGFDDIGNFASAAEVRKTLYEHARIIIALRQGNIETLEREIRHHIAVNREDWFNVG